MLRMRAKVLPFLAISRVGRPLNSFFGSMRLKQRFRWCSILFYKPNCPIFFTCGMEGVILLLIDWKVVLSSSVSGIAFIYWFFTFHSLECRHQKWSFLYFYTSILARIETQKQNETACQVSLVVRHTSFGERLWLLEEAPDCIPIMWWT